MSSSAQACEALDDDPATWTRVMLVEDSDAQVRGVMKVFAGHPDLVVIGRASTGVHAIALGKRLQPQVVVLDLSLPDISGWQVAAELRRTLPGTRIVIMSAHDSTSHRDAARNIGAVFVRKLDAERDLVTAVSPTRPEP